MPESGGFGLYLASFRDFDTKLEEGEQLGQNHYLGLFQKVQLGSWPVGIRVPMGGSEL